MKKTQFNEFVNSLKTNYRIDNAIRTITEFIKLVSQLRDTDMMRQAIAIIEDAADKLADLVHNKAEDDITNTTCKPSDHE